MTGTAASEGKEAEEDQVTINSTPRFSPAWLLVKHDKFTLNISGVISETLPKQFLNTVEIERISALLKT